MRPRIDASPLSREEDETWPVQKEKQGEQGVVPDGHRDGRRGEPVGQHVAWHAGCAVPDGERFGKDGVPYVAPHARQDAPGGRLPE